MLVRWFLKVAVVWAFVLTSKCQQVPMISDGLLNDREALLALRSAISDYGNSHVRTWRPTGNPCFPQPWRHITCAVRRVVKIDLANRQVRGFLPGKLNLASELMEINLESNSFTGTIPSAWARRNSFTLLQTLNLANNELTGSLPNWNRAGAWRSLRWVDLSSNNFYGGLPSSWLASQRPLMNVYYLDISRNFLGRSAGSMSGTLLTKAQWCKSESAAGLPAGSGWCPANTPISRTVASLEYLDLSDNDLVGQLPSQWPTIFQRLQYLYLQFNSLGSQISVDTNTVTIPTPLPAPWTSNFKRSFPALSILTLYPGNDFLCSLPDVSGNYQDVNVDATYRVSDNNFEVFDRDNPWVCPTEYTEDNPVQSTVGNVPTISDSALTWKFAVNDATPIWGFRLSIFVQDDGEEDWYALPNWFSVLVRSYVNGVDNFDLSDRGAQGLAYDGTSLWTLTFASVTDSRISTPSYTTDMNKRKLEVSVVNVDGVDSSIVDSGEQIIP